MGTVDCSVRRRSGNIIDRLRSRVRCWRNAAENRENDETSRRTGNLTSSLYFLTRVLRRVLRRVRSRVLRRDGQFPIHGGEPARSGRVQWTNSHTFRRDIYEATTIIGVHVRRGDMLIEYHRKTGFTVAPDSCLLHLFRKDWILSIPAPSTLTVHHSL
ncbi:hypothetical protein BV898_18793 [Hypsibius exemplaris]|uniref:L-Fucosyltransferase n=1 Tax=Hypsibius exemplaris TaxID=2072580 RepID=A0A9X6NJI7_HYPEX|nr:hypothetical protein BV898_18793 [Hypsibius exemplaris]